MERYQDFTKFETSTCVPHLCTRNNLNTDIISYMYYGYDEKHCMAAQHAKERGFQCFMFQLERENMKLT